jgi:type IV pilus assembly protein PilV
MPERIHAQGFTLIEVLVALVIVLVGVLGAAGLTVKTVQQEAESYQRVQALALLQEMVDRISANRQVAACYANGGSGWVLGSGASATLLCSSGTSAQQAQAIADLTQWDSHLKGTAEQGGSINVGAVIGARGCISLISATDQTYRITVAWQGLAPTVAPVSSCGQGSYGSNDALRRTVNAVIRIGNLTS